MTKNILLFVEKIFKIYIFLWQVILRRLLGQESPFSSSLFSPSFCLFVCLFVSSSNYWVIWALSQVIAYRKAWGTAEKMGQFLPSSGGLSFWFFVFLKELSEQGVKSSSGLWGVNWWRGGEASQLLEREVQIRQIKGWRRGCRIWKGDRRRVRKFIWFFKFRDTLSHLFINSMKEAIFSVLSLETSRCQLKCFPLILSGQYIFQSSTKTD